MAAGSGQQFTAIVDGSGTGHGRVTWQVNGVTGGNTDTGTIDTTGFYNAPLTLTPVTVTVTAISAIDDTKTDSTTVDIRTASSSNQPAPDALGTVKDFMGPLDCATVLDANLGVPNATCYEATVSQCPDGNGGEIADQMVGLKVSFPSGASQGTITFIPGGGGPTWYDQEFDQGVDEKGNPCCGVQIIQDMASAGYTAVQTSFGFLPTGYPGTAMNNGWLSGPGGPRKLACRWATVEKWIHDDPLHIGFHGGSTPMCHTGNSGGVGGPAYALAHYGFDDLGIFKFVEATSGPPFTRVDQGCLCSGPMVDAQCGRGLLSTCYLDDSKFLDFSYSTTNPECSKAETSHATTNRSKYVNDSILSPDANLAYPNTKIQFVFGEDDLGSAGPQAIQWWEVMTAKNGNQQAPACLPGVTHELANYTLGRDQIESDLKASCK